MANETHINPLDFKPNTAIGVSLPLVTTPDHLFKLNYTTLEQVKTDLKNLILTSKGERYMLPDYGTNLRKVLFEQQGEEFLNSIEEEIINAIEKWLPIVLVNEIDVNQDQYDEHKFSISIKYSTKLDSSQIDELNIQVITR